MQALMNWFTGCDVLGDPDAMLILTYLAALDDPESEVPISPVMKSGEMFERMLGIPIDRGTAAFQKLLDTGEVIAIANEQWRGYKVARLEKLVADMRNGSKRRYQRRKEAEVPA
jgi:hypothetical protein